MKPLAREVGGKFAEALTRLKLSKVAAAKQIGVSRQMLYEYLKGRSLPGDDILGVACKEWGLKIDYKGFILDSKSLATKAAPTGTITKQLHLDLQKALDTLTQEDLGIRLERKQNGTLELRIEVKFGT